MGFGFGGSTCKVLGVFMRRQFRIWGGGFRVSGSGLADTAEWLASLLFARFCC